MAVERERKWKWLAEVEVRKTCEAKFHRCKSAAAFGRFPLRERRLAHGWTQIASAITVLAPTILDSAVKCVANLSETAPQPGGLRQLNQLSEPSPFHHSEVRICKFDTNDSGDGALLADDGLDAWRVLGTRSEEEMIQGVRERMVEAVRIRPVGAYLSGGLDSSSVAGIVARSSCVKRPSSRVKVVLTGIFPSHSLAHGSSTTSALALPWNGPLSVLPRSQDPPDRGDDGWPGSENMVNKWHPLHTSVSSSCGEAAIRLAVLTEDPLLAHLNSAFTRPSSLFSESPQPMTPFLVWLELDCYGFNIYLASREAPIVVNESKGMISWRNAIPILAYDFDRTAVLGDADLLCLDQSVQFRGAINQQIINLSQISSIIDSKRFVLLINLVPRITRALVIHLCYALLEGTIKHSVDRRSAQTLIDHLMESCGRPRLLHRGISTTENPHASKCIFSGLKTFERDSTLLPLHYDQDMFHHDISTELHAIGREGTSLLWGLDKKTLNDLEQVIDFDSQVIMLLFHSLAAEAMRRTDSRLPFLNFKSKRVSLHLVYLVFVVPYPPFYDQGKLTGAYLSKSRTMNTVTAYRRSTLMLEGGGQSDLSNRAIDRRQTFEPIDWPAFKEKCELERNRTATSDEFSEFYLEPEYVGGGLILRREYIIYRQLLFQATTSYPSRNGLWWRDASWVFVIFLLGGSLAIFAAFNSNRSSDSDGRLNKEENQPSTTKYFPPLLGKKEWIWWPPWAEFKSLYLPNPAFQAGLISVVGGVILNSSAIAGFPSILGDPSSPDFPSKLQNAVLLPLVIGGACLAAGSLRLIILAQTSWYKPAILSLAWHASFWNMVGAISLSLRTSHVCDCVYFRYLVVLACFVSSLAYDYGILSQMKPRRVADCISQWAQSNPSFIPSPRSFNTTLVQSLLGYVLIPLSDVLLFTGSASRFEANSLLNNPGLGVRQCDIRLHFWLLVSFLLGLTLPRDSHMAPQSFLSKLQGWHSIRKGKYEEGNSDLRSGFHLEDSQILRNKENVDKKNFQQTCDSGRGVDISFASILGGDLGPWIKGPYLPTEGHIRKSSLVYIERSSKVEEISSQLRALHFSAGPSSGQLQSGDQ
ncbi:asparagine synthase domain-containing protein [Hirsutella rhossiliensis]